MSQEEERVAAATEIEAALRDALALDILYSTGEEILVDEYITITTGTSAETGKPTFRVIRGEHQVWHTTFGMLERARQQLQEQFREEGQ